MFKKIIAIILMQMVPLAYAADLASWGYDKNNGPAVWARLSPANTQCVVGKRQSPINVEGSATTAKNLLTIKYSPAPLIITDDGVTPLMVGDKKLIVNLGHTIELSFPGTKEHIVYNGEFYDLLQLHFHTPAENSLNGKIYPAEIHIVHQGEHGKVVVIAVFIKEGKANPALSRIINNTPGGKGKSITVPNNGINPISFLPHNRSYYSFDGSLTTPPCVEGIQWIVMKQPITASAEQIKKLSQVIGIENARPLQADNERKILFFNQK